MCDRVTFDHYCVSRCADGSRWELGRGAMGVTYKAQDVNLECPVALKVIEATRFKRKTQREQFVREARAAARVRHPNVASVYHLGSDQDHFFYAMEFIEGATAQKLVDRWGPMRTDAALLLTSQVARALSAASRHGLVHGDIKPANIMITSDAHEGTEGVLAKVIDFGLVRAAATSPEHLGFAGTPQFASPEQAEERPLDGRSDVYSLGCTLWFMLTGKAPFTGTVASVFAQHLQSEPPWGELNHELPQVRSLLARMLAKDPEARPRDGTELRREIEQCLALVQRRSALGASLARGRRWATAHFPTRSTAVMCGIPLLAITTLAMSSMGGGQPSLAVAPAPAVEVVSPEIPQGAPLDGERLWFAESAWKLNTDLAFPVLDDLPPIGELTFMSPAMENGTEHERPEYPPFDLAGSTEIADNSYLVARQHPQSFAEQVSLLDESIKDDADEVDPEPTAAASAPTKSHRSKSTRVRRNTHRRTSQRPFYPIAQLKKVHRTVKGIIYRVF